MRYKNMNEDTQEEHEFLGTIESGSSAYGRLCRLREQLVARGICMDADKILRGGVSGVLNLIHAVKIDCAAISAFLTGVVVGDTRLYGKEWAWLCVAAFMRGELLFEHYRAWAHQRGVQGPAGLGDWQAIRQGCLCGVSKL